MFIISNASRVAHVSQGKELANSVPWKWFNPSFRLNLRTSVLVDKQRTSRTDDKTLNSIRRSQPQKHYLFVFKYTTLLDKFSSSLLVLSRC